MSILNFSVQIILKTSRMGPYSLLLSCLHDNYLRKFRKCMQSVTILLLHVDGMKSILFNHLINPKAYG
jgi:hypothetical protein